MDSETVLQLECAQGEDVAWQIFWADEYNEPVPIVDPVLCDVKDANGQIALRFASVGVDPAHAAFIETTGYVGFFQMTAPAEVTRTLVPGRYAFDLWAAVADSSGPFANQLVPVMSGWFVALPRVTVVEAAGGAVVNSTLTPA